ncbi:hypothetical protein ACSTKI_00110, partial [Vibrio parahaemolyticus]
PVAVAVGRLGTILISDTVGRIQVFHADGKFITAWGCSGDSDNQFNGAPTGMCLDLLGRLYVVDSGNCRVQVFFV